MSRTKHLVHCGLLFSLIIMLEISGGGINFSDVTPRDFDPWEMYGFFGCSLLYLIRLFAFLPLPHILINFLGLVLYNAFPDRVQLKGSPIVAPFICIRVVTRGDYPQLVRNNVSRNLAKCLDAGLKNFRIEVVTDKLISLPHDMYVREIVVPGGYKTQTGALFKARALQYCLEDDVNCLSDSDWIVHLDEETILTENSIRGILNFVLDGRHSFGQGLITYANEEVVNWITTLADSFRVADDMGKLRAQFNLFGKPLFNWKGSYVVTQVQAERDVTFDNGPDGSVAEDCFFAMRAYQKGYSFAFVEGEMWEKSPFTLWDFLQQRKRWLQGILLVVHSKAISWKYKVFLGISCYSWVTMPISTSNILLNFIWPIPCPPLMDFVCIFISAVSIYMYIFGVIKSFSLYRFGFVKIIIFMLGALATIPVNIIIENAAVIWGLFGKKHKFYIVEKNLNPTIVV